MQKNTEYHSLNMQVAIRDRTNSALFADSMIEFWEKISLAYQETQWNSIFLNIGEQ